MSATTKGFRVKHHKIMDVLEIRLLPAQAALLLQALDFLRLDDDENHECVRLADELYNAITQEIEA